MAAIPALEAALAPAEPMALAVALGKLVDWITDFGIVALPADDEARAAYKTRLVVRYKEHLSVLPSDLAVQCVEETMASHRFRNLPLPAEMISRVSSELGRRRNALGACRLALKLNRFEPAPLGAEDRVRPEQLRALRLEIGGAGAARAMPGADTPEYGEPAPPPDPRADRAADA